MDSISSFSVNMNIGFISRDRFETKRKYDNMIEKENNLLQKKFLGIKKDLEDMIHQIGEKI